MTDRKAINELKRRQKAIGVAITALQEREEQSKVDAVPVVRCKNCKHKKMTGRAPFMIFVCNHDKGLADSIEDNDFCSYGEWRADHEADRC